MTLHRMATALWNLFRRRQMEQELENEIRAHFELAEQEGRAAGLSAEEARAQALRRFGGVQLMKEEHRDHRGFHRMETLIRDFRYGIAALARNPGFSATAIGVLALGIGANTAMFSLVDAVLLRPLPFPEPDRIVRLWEDTHNSINTLDLLDWMRLNTVFSALSAERPVSAALTGTEEPVRLEGMGVSANYFDVFGVKAQLGRTFVAEEDDAGSAPVVVLSDASWRARFGGDPGVINSKILLDGEPHTVVGVLAPGAFDRDRAEYWQPLHYTPDQMNRGFHWLNAVARLRPGVTLEQARKEMSAIDASLTDLSPGWKRDWGVTVEPYDQRLVNDTLRQSLQVAFGAVAVVLLIACANVANLLLARGSARKKEMSVRAALGASRGRLMEQLLAESFALCIAGGVAGLAVAHLLIRLVTPWLKESLPYTADVTLDLRVLGFTAVVVFAVSLLSGLLPSLQTSFTRLAGSMNAVARGSSTSRETLRRTIVAAEVAFSLILICGAVLLFESLWKLQQVDTGVRISNVVGLSVDLPMAAYPKPDNAAAFYRAVVEQIEAIPGVARASVSSDLPMEGVRQGEGLRMPGVEGGSTVRYKRIDANYLGALQIPVLAGRGFTDRDRAGSAPVALINETLAAEIARLYKVDNPIGRIFEVSTPNYENSTGDGAPLEVVGIVRNERTEGLAEDNVTVAYVPLAQVPRVNIKLVVQTLVEPASVIPAIREAVRRVDRNLPVGDIRTMEQVYERALGGSKQPALLIGAFAAVAALLAALGLYGVLAHAVTLRRREIGIRMALGAHPSNVVAQVLRTAMAMVAAGLVAGLLGAFALTRVMESLLFGVSALDPAALIVASVTMALIGLVAGWIPASRAAAVDPNAVLRDEG